MSASETTPLLSEDASTHQSAPQVDHSSERQARSDGEDILESVEQHVASSNASTTDTQMDPESGVAAGGTKITDNSKYRKLRAYFSAEIASNRYLQAQLLFLTFTTGIVDAACLTKYGCFASKQTGNTVFLALRVVRHPYTLDQEEMNIVFSFIAFVLGCAAFAKLGHIINHRRRISLLFSAGIQTLLTWIATVLVCFVTDQDVWPTAPVILALLGVSFGGQIAIAIQTKQQELNTTMVTGVVIQLCNDAKILDFSNPSRTKRVLYFFCFFFGVITGGAITVYATSREAFVVHAIFKTTATLSFLSNPEADEVDDGRSENPRRRSRSPLFRIIWGNTD